MEWYWTLLLNKVFQTWHRNSQIFRMWDDCKWKTWSQHLNSPLWVFHDHESLYLRLFRFYKYSLVLLGDYLSTRRKYTLELRSMGTYSPRTHSWYSLHITLCNTRLWTLILHSELRMCNLPLVSLLSSRQIECDRFDGIQASRSSQKEIESLLSLFYQLLFLKYHSFYKTK